MIEVTAAIIQKDNKILIARRGEGKHLAGFWEFPGGKLEEGEDYKECLKREIKEELGLDIDVGNLFLNSKHTYGTKEISLTSFSCKILSGEITIHDHDQVEWVTIEEMQNFDFAPADLPIINKLLTHA